ncbi:MAG: Mut7-C ubiquitin/RNAse domain-containing protein [Ardenticatenales bacterium]|nr:Mut7-C ubiquitin/RNAse domain-containing protein [Ardenticatenales bacterium]
MSVATFRFYGELNDFLMPAQRQTDITRTFQEPVSVKHLIEALGVPHTEVDGILANGHPTDFHHLAADGDRFAIYPTFTSLDAPSWPRLRPPLPRPPCFILDGHLGRLATYLRLLGFDTRYENDSDDADLAQLAGAEQRVLVTRDQGLLMRKIVTYGCCLWSRDPRQQLLTVLRRFQLTADVRPWRRCLRCNGLLHPVDKAAVLPRLQPKTRLYYEEFHQCQACGHIYWKGSHYGALQAFIADVLAQAARA